MSKEDQLKALLRELRRVKREKNDEINQAEEDKWTRRILFILWPIVFLISVLVLRGR